MRATLVLALAGIALVPLIACNKPAPAGANAAAPAGGAAASASPAGAGPISVSDIPHRKPGLWRETMSMQGYASGMTSQLCVDAASEAKASAFGQSNNPNQHCSPTQFTRNLDGSITFSASCDMGAGGKAATTGAITGDFNSNYSAVVQTQISGSSMAAMNGARKMTISANWTGPCAPGQKGGDMILPNGQTRNILDAQSGAAAPPAGTQ